MRWRNGLPDRSFPACTPDDGRASRAPATPSPEKAVGSKPVTLATALTAATFSCTMSQSMPGRLDLDQAAAIGLRERRSSSPLSLTDECESRDHDRRWGIAPRTELVVSGIQSDLRNWLIGDRAKTSHARYGLAAPKARLSKAPPR